MFLTASTPLVSVMSSSMSHYSATRNVSTGKRMPVVVC